MFPLGSIPSYSQPRFSLRERPYSGHVFQKAWGQLSTWRANQLAIGSMLSHPLFKGPLFLSHLISQTSKIIKVNLWYKFYF